jgi:glycosyltransferase involved in cell wall biosynthesis
MRIALVYPEAPGSMAGNVDESSLHAHVTELGRNLNTQGQHVDVHALPVDPIERPGQAIDELDRSWSMRPPDVVHAHLWTCGFAALAALRDIAALDTLPVVLTFHSLESPNGRTPSARSRWLRLKAAVARGVDRVAASSRRELADLVLLGVRRRRVEVIPNGVDTDLFTPADRRHGRTRPTPRLVATGPLTPATGFETAIRALPGVPGAELMIAGGPPAGHGDGWTLTTDPEFNRLQTLANELGIGDRARLTELPGRHELPALLHSADIVVSTPEYDAPGTVEIEAMACGRPVVGTAVGDLADVVLEGTTGVLVRPNDPPALAHAINELLSDAVRMEGFGLAAVERARTRHSWPRITEEITGVYERALAN